MQKILATTLILLMAACGSASQTGPKTSNPPLTAGQRPKAPKPDAPKDEPPPIEQDGLTLKFNHLGFKITMTPSAWKGHYSEDPKEGARIAFDRDDLTSVLLIIPVVAKDTDAKAIADDQHDKAAKDATLTVSAVSVESGGRYVFTIDRVQDGVPHRTYLAVTAHPSISDAYIIGVAEGTTSTSDAFLKEVRAVLDSIASLP